MLTAPLARQTAPQRTKDPKPQITWPLPGQGHTVSLPCENTMQLSWLLFFFTAECSRDWWCRSHLCLCSLHLAPPGLCYCLALTLHSSHILLPTWPRLSNMLTHSVLHVVPSRMVIFMVYQSFPELPNSFPGHLILEVDHMSKCVASLRPSTSFCCISLPASHPLIFI